MEIPAGGRVLSDEEIFGRNPQKEAAYLAAKAPVIKPVRKTIPSFGFTVKYALNRMFDAGAIYGLWRGALELFEKYYPQIASLPQTAPNEKNIFSLPFASNISIALPSDRLLANIGMHAGEIIAFGAIAFTYSALRKLIEGVRRQTPFYLDPLFDPEEWVATHKNTMRGILAALPHLINTAPLFGLDRIVYSKEVSDERPGFVEIKELKAEVIEPMKIEKPEERQGLESGILKDKQVSSGIPVKQLPYGGRGNIVKRE